MTREDRLTMASVRYIRSKYPKTVVLHIANERKTSARRGAKLRKMGVMAGVADLFVAHPTANDAGLWIELKVDKSYGAKRKSYPNSNQKEFLWKMHQSGYAVAVCWNLDQLMETVDTYMSGEPLFCDYLEKTFNKMMDMKELPTHIRFSLSKSQFECKHCGEVKEVPQGTNQPGVTVLESTRDAMYEQHKDCEKQDGKSEKAEVRSINP